MQARLRTQPHLEYRPTGFHWRRRWPGRIRKICDSPEKSFLLFSLRSHVIPDARALAQKLTLLSDVAFAGVTERTMAIAPDIMDRLLVELCRFLIEAADVARETAPARSPDTAAYELACANAAMDSLRTAIATRDRDMARDPLRAVAARLGVTLDEDDPDWRRLAFRALRVMLEAEQENHRRDQGQFETPSAAFQTARPLVDAPHAQKDADDLAACRPAPMGLSHTRYAHPMSPTSGPAASDHGAVTPDGPRASKGPEAAPDAVGTALKQEASVAAAQGTPPCPSITEGAQIYIDLRSKGYKTFKPNEQTNEKAGASWARNTAPNVRSTACLMSRILGDKPYDQITDADLKHAWELIARLPRSYQAKTAKLSPQQAADEADATEKHNQEITCARLRKKGASPGKIESEMLKYRLPRLRTATIYRHMQDHQRICVCMKKQGHVPSNIMEDHIWDSAEYLRRETLEEDNERLTWCGHLDGLFRSPIFQEKLEDVGDPMFWAPLIAVHMGLRSEEILQLYVSDIKIIGDVPCIVLRQGPGQSLKSLAARRTLPIHDNLLKLGFMKLVALRERDEEPRLFPWIERSQSKKTFTETFSKRFTRYRQDHNIYDTQRDFHSLRTSFNHLLIVAECPDTQRRALMGHVERDIGITNYNPHGFSEELLQRRVNSIEVDISMIRPPFEEPRSTNVAHLSDRRQPRPA